MSLDRAEYTEELRKRCLVKIDDLRHKINSNAKLPVGDEYGEQDMEFLTELEEKLDECLGAWYY